MMDIKIILYANNKKYELNEPDDILDILIDYNYFVSVDIEINLNGRHFSENIYSKFKNEDFKYNENLHNIDFSIDKNLERVLSELRIVLKYLKKDYKNFEEVSK